MDKQANIGLHALTFIFLSVSTQIRALLVIKQLSFLPLLFFSLTFSTDQDSTIIVSCSLAKAIKNFSRILFRNNTNCSCPRWSVFFSNRKWLEKKTGQRGHRLLAYLSFLQQLTSVHSCLSNSFAASNIFISVYTSIYTEWVMHTYICTHRCLYFTHAFWLFSWWFCYWIVKILWEEK